MAVVLITGSCGLVGSESSEFFSGKGFEILGIDNNSRRNFFGKDGDINWVKNRLKKNLKNYKHFNLDITSYKNLEKIFRKYKKNIKLVIHSAAQPSHDWAKTNIFKDFDINAKGTINLLELTKKYCYDAPFIFMSCSSSISPTISSIMSSKVTIPINVPYSSTTKAKCLCFFLNSCS